MNPVIKVTGDNIKWDKNGIETDGQVTLVKYEEYIDEVIRELVYESWMSEEDYKTIVDIMEKSGELNKQEISDAIEQGAKNGYTVQQQVTIVKLIINRLK